MKTMTFNVPKKSAFAEEFNFDDIRPHYDHEILPVLLKIIEEPKFMLMAEYVWPEITKEQVKEKAMKVDTAFAFQKLFMHEGIRAIVRKSSTGLSISGIEKLDKNDAYLYVANHRDILLDSAILQILLVEHGFETSEISFGSNLMEKGFITDFGRINRMFMVQREGTSKELYEISRKLSAYIRHTIVDKKTSAWIAQRNGRTKNGFDATQTGLLKMLQMSGSKNFVENISQLKIVPLTISYEYEPCDVMKTQELYLSSMHGKYIKTEGEDLQSILTGILQPKGHIHLAFGTPIVSELAEFEKAGNDNEKIKRLTAEIDRQIFANYKVWPTNYIAYDILNGSIKFSNFYTSDEKAKFEAYMNHQLKNINGEQESLRSIFLKMYAAPITNL